MLAHTSTCIYRYTARRCRYELEPNGMRNDLYIVVALLSVWFNNIRKVSLNLCSIGTDHTLSVYECVIGSSDLGRVTHHHLERLDSVPILELRLLCI